MLYCMTYDGYSHGSVSGRCLVSSIVSQQSKLFNGWRGCFCCVGDLGLILDKTVKLEWHRTNNMRTRCLRITQKVSCTLLCSPYCINCHTATWMRTDGGCFVCFYVFIVVICHVRYVGWQDSVHCVAFSATVFHG